MLKQTRGRGIAAEHDTRIVHIDAALDDFELRQMQVAVEHPAIGCVENASRRDFAAIAVDEGILSRPSMLAIWDQLTSHGSGFAGRVT